KELIFAHRYLAELKGIARTIPNEKILLLNLTLQEAKDSSAIENIITTQDSLYAHYINPKENTVDKEVHNYSKALLFGWEKVKSSSGISCNTIIEIHKFIEPDKSGFRKVPGTVLKNTATNEVVYSPPSPEKIPNLMKQFEDIINTNSMDPLVKMAVSHLYFESIHPFYDGNGRTGRIINILYLLLNNLLESPILYLSRYILKNRSDYYRLLQQVREQENWIDWIIYILKGISQISQETKELIRKIDELFKEYKNIIRGKYKFYSHDLINNIFSYPYTKVKHLEENMDISRATATRYLDVLAKDNILEKSKIGRESYYINRKLFNLLKNS
ncbi:MAG: Fic family protein, partial [Bdellovibrionaceae bacterium]|nr:Fic family protein [Pseudobdellovibrionaceae bacterium]